MSNRGSPDLVTSVHLRCLTSPLVLRCQTTDVYAAWDLLFYGEYSPLKPLDCRVVVDCGANVGMFLASLLKNDGQRPPLERYIGIEPDEDAFEILKRQVESFQVADRSTLLKAAVSDRDATVCFDDSGPSWDHHLSPSGTRRVAAMTLPTVMNAAAVDQCDLLKVDIEGAEADVFQTMDRWKDRVKAIACEIHPPLTFEWFAGIMASHGFNAYPAGRFFRGSPGAVRADLDPH